MKSEEQEAAAEDLADRLATWWEDHTGEETYAHQWTKAAEHVAAVGPDRSA